MQIVILQMVKTMILKNYQMINWNSLLNRMRKNGILNILSMVTKIWNLINEWAKIIPVTTAGYGLKLSDFNGVIFKNRYICVSFYDSFQIVP